MTSQTDARGCVTNIAYDELDRLRTSNVTGGSNGLYSEGYTYNDTTGNLASKNNVNYTAYDANHKHAVTNLSNGNSYGYDANGNMTSRHVLEGTEFNDYTLSYDAENRLVSVTGDATASFVYDGDSKQVKATVNGVTTYYVGNHYEVKSGVVTKYYFAGSTRLAVRTNGTLSYLLGDHIGSSSVTTDANGAKTATALYKAFGETRYTLGNLGTDYKFTGQREEASLGIYFFNARWMDPSLGRFTSPDTIVPTSTQGTQAWDRYAFVNNNPVRYNDPTGHMCREDGKGCDGSWRNPSSGSGSSSNGWSDPPAGDEDGNNSDKPKPVQACTLSHMTHFDERTYLLNPVGPTFLGKYPVYSVSGELIGYVEVYYRPDEFQYFNFNAAVGLPPLEGLGLTTAVTLLEWGLPKAFPAVLGVESLPPVASLTIATITGLVILNQSAFYSGKMVKLFVPNPYKKDPNFEQHLQEMQNPFPAFFP